jgi:hypothetical protein
MMKSLSLVHQTQIRYLGSAGATLLTDIAPISFFGSPLFLFIFSLAIFLVYGFLLSINPFVKRRNHARAHHHPGARPCTTILKFFFFFAISFPRSFAYVSVVTSQTGCLLRPRSACRNVRNRFLFFSSFKLFANLSYFPFVAKWGQCGITVLRHAKLCSVVSKLDRTSVSSNAAGNYVYDVNLLLNKCQQLRTQLVRHSRACVSYSLKFFLFFIIIPHSLHYYIILFRNYDVMVFVPPPTPPPVASQFASVTDPLSWYSLLLTQL